MRTVRRNGHESAAGPRLSRRYDVAAVGGCHAGTRHAMRTVILIGPMSDQKSWVPLDFGAEDGVVAGREGSTAQTLAIAKWCHRKRQETSRELGLRLRRRFTAVSLPEHYQSQRMRTLARKRGGGWYVPDGRLRDELCRGKGRL